MASKAQVERAIEIHGSALEKLPHVVALGITPVKGKRGSRALAVYVKKIDRRRGKAVPEELEIPGRGKTTKIPIRVIEEGPFEAEEEFGAGG